MTPAATLPIIGKVNFTRHHEGGHCWQFWDDSSAGSRAAINYGERVEVQNATASGFLRPHHAASLRARTVLLAIGRRGTPRKLDVPGRGSVLRSCIG